MVDAGRVPETIAYYRRVIEFCADWELNTLQFRLADDQGSAMRFTSVPDLVTHKNAFTARTIEEPGRVWPKPRCRLDPRTGIVRTHGIHYPLFRVRSFTGPGSTGPSEFTGIIPVHPETLQLFEKLYREVATIFPSIYLHGGCDEVNWGGSMLSRKALQTKTRAQIWAEYLNSLNQISAGLGKQLIVWGDIVLHKEPEILGQLSKNIIVMDWNYSDNSSAKIRRPSRKSAPMALVESERPR